MSKNIAKVLQVGNVREKQTSGLSFSIPSLLKGFMQNGMNVDFLNIKNNGLRLNLGGIDIKSYEVIVFHSFFIIQHLLILLKAKKNATIVVTPRGGFTNKNKLIWKKRIYSFIYFKIISLKKLDVKIHYLTQAEYDNSIFKNFRYFIVGNSVPEDSILLSPITKYDNLNQINIVYLGRFHTYIKGLDILLKHIIENREAYMKNSVVFNLYGPESEDKLLLMDLALKNEIENVFFHPPVYGEEKIKVLDTATFHIMTSRSEGFPMAILESLARGCPQILTEGTNMLPLLRKYKFGIEFNENLLVDLLKMDVESYNIMAEQSIVCARNHSSKNIAFETYKEYIK